jgi:hypothetical protein
MVESLERPVKKQLRSKNATNAGPETSQVHNAPRGAAKTMR